MVCLSCPVYDRSRMAGADRSVRAEASRSYLIGQSGGRRDGDAGAGGGGGIRRQVRRMREQAENQGKYIFKNFSKIRNLDLAKCYLGFFL